MYDRVLVAIDGDEGSETVLDHALTIAENHGAEIYALYVVDRRVYASAFDEGPSSRKDELREEGEDAVGTVKARAAERGLDATTAVRDGDPTKVVPAYADEVDADLLVVGSHGKTPREKVQGLGSVSEAVVKSTDRAVLVVGVGSGRGADRDAGEEADEEADE